MTILMSHLLHLRMSRRVTLARAGPKQPTVKLTTGMAFTQGLPFKRGLQDFQCLFPKRLHR